MSLDPREYDREFIDGCSVADLDSELIKIVADQISPGISVDRCLQYLGLAEYDGVLGLRLRRSAALLFSKNIDKWHPRVQVRILRVQGVELGVGERYNVKSDETVKANIVRLIDDAWERIRPHLVETRFQDDARFRSTFIYPEVACREAIVNAIAHRDYSDEGLGIEVYVYDDRIEVKNPGNLLSGVTVSDIKLLTGVHQSRNSYVARTLREVGVMRELGEGMRRIFEVMRHSEMAEPEIISDGGSFKLILLNKAMYSRDETLFLDGYREYNLSPEEKSLVLMGRLGGLVSPNDIWVRLGIVDTEHYRQLIESLQKKGILKTEIGKAAVFAQSREQGKPRKSIPKFRIIFPDKIVETRRSNYAVKKDINRKSFSSSNKNGVEVEKESEEVTLHIGNISPLATEKDIVMALSDLSLEDVILPKSWGGGNRGYAFVVCQSEEDARSIIGREFSIIGRRAVVSVRRSR